MRRASVRALAMVAAVASTAILGTAAVSAGQTDGASCTCSTVDLESGSVTLVVVSEAGSASVSQQVSQVNDHARVRIDAEYGETAVEIAGETAANGSLVLNVTQDGEVVNESVVADGDETDTVVFRVSSDDVRVDAGGDVPAECACGDADTNADGAAAGDGVPGVDDVPGVDIGGSCGVGSDVEVNVGATGGVNVGDGVDVDVNATKSVECAEDGSSPSERVRTAALSFTSGGQFAGQITDLKPEEKRN